MITPIPVIYLKVLVLLYAIIWRDMREWTTDPGNPWKSRSSIYGPQLLDLLRFCKSFVQGTGKKFFFFVIIYEWDRLVYTSTIPVEVRVCVLGEIERESVMQKFFIEFTSSQFPKLIYSYYSWCCVLYTSLPHLTYIQQTKKNLSCSLDKTFAKAL